MKKIIYAVLLSLLILVIWIGWFSVILSGEMSKDVTPEHDNGLGESMAFGLIILILATLGLFGYWGEAIKKLKED